MSSSNSPCAACKFLRRKCTQECVFAPYFPPDQPTRFANVHRVFGASNVAKILNELPAGHREDAVNSLAYEAEARLKDPVYGCVGLISLLQQRLKQVQTDLLVAKQELSTYIGPAMLPTPGYNPAAGGFNNMAHMMVGPSHMVGGGGGSGAQLVIRDVEQQQQHQHQQQIQIQNAQQLIETQQLQQAMMRNWEQQQQQLMRFNASGGVGGSGSGGGGFCGTYEIGGGSNTPTMGVTPGDGFNQMDSPSLALGVSPGVGTSYDQNVTVTYAHQNVEDNERLGQLLLLQQPEPPQQPPVDVAQAAIPLFHHFHPVHPQHHHQPQQEPIILQHNLEHEQEQHLHLDINQLQHQDIHEHHHQRSASEEDMTNNATTAPGPGF